MELPKNFVRLYGKNLSSSVFLRPPCGSNWKINLENRDEKVWLHQGWPEFAHYALDFGHFFFFKYKGNSQFQIRICDTSTRQIHYPSIPADLDEADVYGPKKRVTVGDDDSLQTFDCLLSEEEYMPSSSPPPHKRMRANTSDESISTASGDKSTTQNGRKLLSTQSQTPTNKVNTQRSNSHCKYQNPSFVMIMEQSVVMDRYELYLPSEFWRKHLNCQTGDAILYVSSGSTWPVKICVRKSEGQSACLEKDGWKNFARDNNLELGDSCTFQPIEGNRILFKVSISRVADKLHSQR